MLVDFYAGCSISDRFYADCSVLVDESTSVYVSFFFSSRRRHTRCALVTGVQTCALPIYAALAVDDEGDHVGALRAAPGGGDHRAIEAAFGLENAGRIDEQDLRVVLERDAHQPRACGLRLGADDRDQIGRAHV